MLKLHFVASLLLVAISSISHANGADAALTSLLKTAESDCGTSFKLDDTAVTYLDLTEDGIHDIIVVDESGFICPDNGASYYCGSGGCQVHFLAEADQVQGQVQGWEIMQTKHGKKVILLGLHGSACNAIGTVTCFKAMTFNDGRFVYQD